LVSERLAQHLENRAHTRNKLGQVLVYPALLFVVAVAVALMLLTQVVPQVAQVFEQAKVELPWLTRAMLALSATLKTQGLWIAIALLAMITAIIVMFRSQSFGARMDGALLRIPVFGKLLSLADAARFARTMSLATQASVPVLEALRVSSQVVANRKLRAELIEVRNRVREGASLAQSLRNHSSMPSLLSRMIQSGERSGRLSEMLERSAELKERQLNTRLGTLTALVEPVLILLMGALVLTIVLSVLLPIFELNRVLR
jgi:general secretion pathway protein F